MSYTYDEVVYSTYVAREQRKNLMSVITAIVILIIVLLIALAVYYVLKRRKDAQNE